jgi:hypothetical protein
MNYNDDDNYFIIPPADDDFDMDASGGGLYHNNNNYVSLTDDDYLNCLKVYTSYIPENGNESGMPPTPGNTPTSYGSWDYTTISTPKSKLSASSTAAKIYDDQALYELLGVYDHLNATTDSTHGEHSEELGCINEVLDIDNSFMGSPSTATATATSIGGGKILQYTPSLTPFIIHGGIPITFLLMSKMGIGMQQFKGLPSDSIIHTPHHTLHTNQK